MEDVEKTKDMNGESSAPLPHSNRERLTNIEVQRRIQDCYDKRFNSEKPILQRQWVDHCKDVYGDKSVPTYLHYWMKAKEEYDEQWKASLEGLLEETVNVLQEGLRSENHYVRSKTVDQIMKYSGNDIQKHHHLVQQIQIGFDSD